MGRVIMNGPPDCPDGAWCPACLMIAKQMQWEASQEAIEAGYAASGDKLTVIPWLNALTAELQPGRWRAVCGEFMQLGLVDGLCWGHVAGGRLRSPEAASPLAVPPPGFMPKGRGGRHGQH
jgi:hypothetical protein